MRKGILLVVLFSTLLLAILYFITFDYDTTVIDTVKDTKTATLRIRVSAVVKALQSGIVLRFMDDLSQVPDHIDEVQYLDTYRGDMPLCISLNVKNMEAGEYRFSGKILFHDYTVEISDSVLLEDSIEKTSPVAVSACVNRQR